MPVTTAQEALARTYEEMAAVPGYVRHALRNIEVKIHNASGRKRFQVEAALCHLDSEKDQVVGILRRRGFKVTESDEPDLSDKTAITVSWAPMPSIDPKAVLSDPQLRRELVVESLIVAQALMGVTLRRDEAEAIYEKIQGEKPNG